MKRLSCLHCSIHPAVPGWTLGPPPPAPLRALRWLHPPFPQVSKEMAAAWCKEKDIPYFEVSAKNNINVVEAFETLAKQALATVSPPSGAEHPPFTPCGRAPGKRPHQ